MESFWPPTATAAPAADDDPELLPPFAVAEASPAPAVSPLPSPVPTPEPFPSNRPAMELPTSARRAVLEKPEVECEKRRKAMKAKKIRMAESRILVARRLAASSSGDNATNGWRQRSQTISVFAAASGTSLRWPQWSQVA